jgi:hypothetical protein
MRVGIGRLQTQCLFCLVRYLRALFGPVINLRQPDMRIGTAGIQFCRSDESSLCEGEIAADEIQIADG